MAALVLFSFLLYYIGSLARTAVIFKERIGLNIFNTQAGTAIASFLTNFIDMKKILVGALVCAAVAGIVYYLNDPEKFTDTVDDLKKKGKDALGKAKSNFDRAEKDLRNAMNQQA